MLFRSDRVARRRVDLHGESQLGEAVAAPFGGAAAIVPAFGLGADRRDAQEVEQPRPRVGERGVRASSGALIVSVTQKVSDDLGIQTGDVIVQVMNTSIRDARHAKQVLEAYTGKGRIRMFLERGGRIYSTDFSIQ